MRVFAKTHAWPLAAIVFTMVAGYWLITSGTGDIFGAFLEQGLPVDAQTGSSQGGKRLTRGFWQFFDAQGDAMLSGRLDVPCSVLDHEAFVVDGRCYGYFGITPSVLRAGLNLFFPRYWGHWTIVSMLTASCLSLISAYGLILNSRRYLFGSEPLSARFVWMATVYLLALGLGSTNIFLLSRVAVYHEAILWSSTLAICSMYFALRYLVTGRLSAISYSCLAALFAVHARPVAGVAAVLMCLLVTALRVAGTAPMDIKPVKGVWGRVGVLHGLIVVFWIALIFITYGAINFGKFGSFNGHPIRYNYSAERLANIDGSVFHASNWRWNLGTYFGLDGMALKSSFPYVTPSFRTPTKEEIMLRYPEAKIDGVDNAQMGIPISMTALLLFTITGLVACTRYGIRGKVILVASLCAALGPGTMLLFAYQSYRYFHEYLPLFALAGSVGVSVLGLDFPRALGVNAFGTIVTLLTAVNLWLNVSFAVKYQMYDTGVGAPVLTMQERVEQIKTILRPFWGN